ncbi:hypothetical protein GCM10007941_13820 [Amphritea balenae]|nr:hypothetical protein GCM10007941_13820 [Amphritea balenae]
MSRKERARFNPLRGLNPRHTFTSAKKKGYPEGSPFSLHLVEVAGVEPLPNLYNKIKQLSLKTA